MESINFNVKKMFSPEEIKTNEILNDTLIDKIDINILIEENYKYYIELNKILKINEILKVQLNNLKNEKTNLKQKIINIERNNEKLKINNLINDTYINRKRHRRLKNEIKRNFLCKFCSKKYGTECSLNQHLKIKH